MKNMFMGILFLSMVAFALKIHWGSNELIPPLLANVFTHGPQTTPNIISAKTQTRHSQQSSTCIASGGLCHQLKTPKTSGDITPPKKINFLSQPYLLSLSLLLVRAGLILVAVGCIISLIRYESLLFVLPSVASGSHQH